MHPRWCERQRPLPPEVAAVLPHEGPLLAVAGATLDALLRKAGLRRGAAKHPLAGRLTALLALGSRLPRQVW